MVSVIYSFIHVAAFSNQANAGASDRIRKVWDCLWWAKHFARAAQLTKQNILIVSCQIVVGIETPGKVMNGASWRDWF